MTKLTKTTAMGYLLFSLMLFPVSAAIAADTPDLSSPSIKHQTITTTASSGSAVSIKATVTDDVGVKSVTLYYRAQGTENYRPLAMSPGDTPDQYVATVPGVDVTGSKLEYYIQSTDVNGNTVARGGRLFPLSVAVSTTETAPAPTDTTPVATAFDKEINQAEEKSNKYLWAWILGGVVLGAVALGGSDDGGGDNSPPQSGKTGSVTVIGPAP